MALVTCKYCGSKTVDKKSDDYIEYKGKNYHKICGEKEKEKDSFYSYVCLLFGLKAPGPKIYNQANSFISTYKYSFLGMEKTLKYLYEIKKHKDKFDVANKSIGLIPYYYDEAQNYYNNIERVKEKMNVQVEHAKNKERVINVTIKSKERNLTYNLDDID